MSKTVVDLYSYEVFLKNVKEPITIDQAEVVVQDGAYILTREDLVLFSTPVENVVYIKSI